ncbi:hypothetical protein [Caulobacter sp. DWR1-3-2b1]|uniref:hypothetical protein n=1 Tax=Caulobacter sp. DWR1-3-2b1 TaxID=2804670 RepID=UPI003CF5F16D
MSFLAEILAIVVVWLSSVALGQFGIVLDTCPLTKSTSERTVSRSPRGSMPSPVAVAPQSMDTPTA